MDGCVRSKSLYVGPLTPFDCRNPTPQAARRPLVGGRGGVGFLDASAPAAAAAAKKPNVNKHFLANTIRRYAFVRAC